VYIVKLTYQVDLRNFWLIIKKGAIAEEISQHSADSSVVVDEFLCRQI